MATEIRLSLNVSMIIAVVLGELMSTLWYQDNFPWGKRVGPRYFITALLSDAGLVVLLKFIIDGYWKVGGWEDAALLSACLALLYGTLEAPHVINNSRTFTYFFFHVIHKFSIMFVMTACLHFFKHL